MPVVPKSTLKTYFEDGDVPTEPNYIDLIDTMGDLSKVSANRPGVTKLYRRDSDSGYSLQTFWDGTRWTLQGYYADDSFHAGVKVAYADLAASASAVAWANITGKPATFPPSTHLHDADYHRKDQDVVNLNGAAFGANINPPSGVIYANDYMVSMGGLYSGANSDPGTGHVRAIGDFTNSGGIHVGTINGTPGAGNILANGFIDAASYIDATGGFRVNTVSGGILVMYSTSTFKVHTSWDGDSHVVGVYTLTPAMFGYPSNAKALYVLLQAQGSGGVGYVGINNTSGSFNFPISVVSPNGSYSTQYGITHLDASGNMILRIGTVTANVIVQVWGYFI